MENPDQSKENLTSKDFAFGNKVATPDGEKRINYFDKGDSVLAFSAKEESGRIKLESFTEKVNFSSGTGHKHRSTMVYISIKHSHSLTQEIICTPDQVYLLSNGKYTTAYKLRPGLQLVDKGGNPLEIESVSIGDFLGGVHNIATAAKEKNIADGHLLLIDGIITGDFALQLHFNEFSDNLKYKDEYDE